MESDNSEICYPDSDSNASLNERCSRGCPYEIDTDLFSLYVQMVIFGY